MDNSVQVDTKEAKRIIGLKSTAYKEYLGARLLINSHMFQQAGILMTTCLEKEMKAFLLVKGQSVKWVHELPPLYHKIEIIKKEISDNLNFEFLTVLSNIYKTRYYDQLQPGYNFVFIKNKFLAELDYCYSVLEPTLKIKPGWSNEIPKTKYQIDVAEKNSILFKNNYLLNNIEKDSFLSQPELVYEFRIASNHEIFEAQYPIPYNRIEEKNKFLYEGLDQKSSNQFQGSHFGYSQEDYNKLNKLLGTSF